MLTATGMKSVSSSMVSVTANLKRFSAAMTKASLAIERLGTTLNSRAAETEIVRIVRQRQKKDRFRGIKRRRWL